MSRELRASAANTPTATTPENVSHSRGRNVEGKESWEKKTPGLQKKTTTSIVYPQALGVHLITFYDLHEMTEAFMAGVMIFIEQFWAIWPWSIGVIES